jgi:hypothetical protein
MEEIVTQDTSYQTQLAACGAVVDKLVAEHAEEVRTVSVDVNIGHNYGPGKVTLFVDNLAAVVRWARILGVQVRSVYGSGDIMQADARAEVGGVHVHALGSSRCALGKVAHEHKTCLEQARAEAARELAGSVTR